MAEISEDIHHAGQEDTDRMIADHEGVSCCARCGHDHPTLDWKRLTCPVYHGDGEVDTAWAMCPELQEPILAGYRPHAER